MVMPPGTPPDAARTAMTRAVRADNITEATEILIAALPAANSEAEESD
ncbi:hypothetical protein ACIRL3_16370 [Streptomyces sp. NPDC102384]